MSRLPIVTAGILVLASTFTTTLSSKDKNVPFHEMALHVRDAFNCGVVVEQYLHGRLKGDKEGYAKERAAYNCPQVETILGTLHDQDGAAQTP